MARSRELFEGVFRLNVKIEQLLNEMSVWKDGELIELDAVTMDDVAILDGVAGAIRDWVGTIALMNTGLDDKLRMKE